MTDEQRNRRPSGPCSSRRATTRTVQQHRISCDVAQCHSTIISRAEAPCPPCRRPSHKHHPSKVLLPGRLRQDASNVSIGFSFTLPGCAYVPVLCLWGCFTERLAAVKKQTCSSLGGSTIRSSCKLHMKNIVDFDFAKMSSYDDFAFSRSLCLRNMTIR